MRRSAGITLTAAALSVTLGVLVGAVITIGTHARTQSVTSPATGSTPLSAQSADPSSDDPVPSSQNSDSIDSDPSNSVPGSSAPTNTVPTSTAPAGTVPTTSTGRTSPRSVVTSPARSSSSTAKKTAPTPRRAAVVTTLTVVASTTKATPSTPSSATTSTAAPGTPAAGQPCSVLGEKATVADGSTVFCQRNFAVSAALAWRAVVDGGGCLNRRMTGKGADGRNYVCRADATGADHWRPGGR